jgi:uncharacterized membrane protein YeaQ/YmgE (transglycosylase-associated protein family)
MGLLALASCGLLLGLVTWICVPKAGRMGASTTLTLGVAGAFMGAFLTCALANKGISELHLPGLVGGLIGAILLLSVTVRVFPRRAAV